MCQKPLFKNTPPPTALRQSLEGVGRIAHQAAAKVAVPQMAAKLIENEFAYNEDEDEPAKAANLCEPLSGAQINEIATTGLKWLWWKNPRQIFQILAKYKAQGCTSSEFVESPDLSFESIVQSMGVRNMALFAAHSLISMRAMAYKDPVVNIRYAPSYVLESAALLRCGELFSLGDPWQYIAQIPLGALRLRHIIEICRDKGSDAALFGRPRASLRKVAEAAAADGCMGKLIALLESTGLYFWPGIAQELRIATVTDEAQGEEPWQSGGRAEDA